MYAFDRVPQYIFVHWRDGQMGMGSAAWEVKEGGKAVMFGRSLMWRRGILQAAGWWRSCMSFGFRLEVIDGGGLV